MDQTSQRLIMGSASFAPNPEFISASTAVVVDQTITIAAPSGIQNGDLLVLSVIQTSAVARLPVCAGFKIEALNHYDSANNTRTATLLSKVASSESGSYTISLDPAITSGSTGLYAALFVYRNATSVHAVGPFNFQLSTGSSGSTITATASSSLSVTRNCLFGGLFTGSRFVNGFTPSANLVVASQTVLDPAFSREYALACRGNVLALPGSTTSASVAFTTNESTNLSANCTFFAVSNGSFVAAPVFIASTQAGIGSSTSLTVNKPAGTQQGDVMVAVMSASSGVSWTGATDWVEVADQGVSPSLRVAYKVADSSEGADYTFTTSGAADLSGVIVTYRGASWGGSANIVSTSSLLPPGVVAPTNRSVAFIAAAYNSITAFTATGYSTLVLRNVSPRVGILVFNNQQGGNDVPSGDTQFKRVVAGTPHAALQFVLGGS